MLTPEQKKTIVKTYMPDISMAAVGRQYGVSRQTISKLLQRNGVIVKKKKIVIGCDNCEIEPYARGYCSKHYKQWLRLNPGIKERPLKSIGCPGGCKTHYAKGLCRNCYRRQHYHKIV